MNEDPKIVLQPKSTMPNWLSIGIAALTAAGAAAVPVVLPALPTQYSAIAVGAVALISNLYHLFQPSPGATQVQPLQ